MNKDNKLSLYGRAWELVIIPRTASNKDKPPSYFFGDGITSQDNDAIVLSSSRFGDSALRVRFDVVSSMQTPIHSDIYVYNLSQEIITLISKQGARVILSAGYENGSYGEIWNGDVLHYIDYRENVVDRVLQLRCIYGRNVVTNNYIVASIENQTVDDRMRFLTKQIKVEYERTPVVEKEKAKTVRREVFVGRVDRYMRDEAYFLGGQLTVDEEFYGISNIITDDVSTDQALDISPQTGLIGTPNQLPLGLSFRTLLDHRLKFKRPLMTVHLNNSIMKARALEYGQTPSILTDGVVKVVEVRHTGDTRGNEWYSDVETVTNPEMIVRFATAN